jgi:hypothetical protein
MVEVEQRLAHLLHMHGSLALLSLAMWPRVGPRLPFLVDFGADGCAQMKALLNADRGDACRCRIPLRGGGVVPALPMQSHLERRGKPLVRSDSADTIVSSPP